MENKIPIVLSTNDKYVDICSVTISSVIENSSPIYIYEIYVFYTRLSKENVSSLELMSKANIKVKCVNVDKYLDYDILYETSKYPIEMYYRYYAPLIIENEKIIYLDCDIIVVDDIAKLYYEDIESKTVAMVVDFRNYINETNMYFNSGVIVLNTKEFEKQEIRKKCIEELRKNTTYQFPDQTALNIVCKNNVKILKPMYNYQVSLAFNNTFKRKISKKKFKNLFIEKPIIIHFSYITKPYNAIYSIYNKEFWKYAKLTPYYNQLIEKYIENPYEVLKKSPLEDICIDRAREGKAGLKMIFYIFGYQIKFWFLYKIFGGKINEQN